MTVPKQTPEYKRPVPQEIQDLMDQNPLDRNAIAAQWESNDSLEQIRAWLDWLGSKS